MIVLILIILLVAIISVVIFVLSYTGYQFGWYAGLEKPNYYYYDWIYSPIWFLNYGIIIYTWTILMTRSTALTAGGITFLYLLHLILLFLYTFTFYYYRNPEKSLAILIATILSLMMIMIITVLDPILLILLTLYLIWLLYLLYITWQLAILNPLA